MAPTTPLTTPNRRKPLSRAPARTSRRKFVAPPCVSSHAAAFSRGAHRWTNWAQIVPYLVTWRRFADPVLAQSVVVYLGQSRTLDDVLERFTEHDAAMTEAALYSLVANGRVLSSDLSTSPLSGLTRFRRA